MRAGPGTPLKALQWFNRGVQFSCSVLILAIFSYFLGSLSSSGLETPTWIRSVEGISGVAALYTGVCLLLLCCVAGNPVLSFVAMVFDVAFFAAFIYVASANRGGAGSCEGRVDTPFGSGDADKSATDSVPSFRVACRLETACFAMSLIAIFFFLFSLVTEFFLGRQRQRERRLGLAEAHDSTSGFDPKHAGSAEPATPATTTGGGFLGFLRRSTTRRSRLPPAHADPNYLPAHTHPDDVRETYYAPEALTAAAAPSPPPADDDLAMHSYGGGGGAPAYHPGYADSGYGGATAAPAARNSWERGYARPGHQDLEAVSPPTPATARFPAGNYRYDDGVYDAWRR